jgi:flagellar biosynthetic protein FliO
VSGTGLFSQLPVNKLPFNEYYSVTRYRQKIIVFFTVVILGCGAFVALANDPNFVTNSDEDTSDMLGGNQELFFKMMLSVLLVITLGAVAIYASKRLLPRITNLPGKQIRVLETHYLGPKKAIHLIEIDNHRLLIGSTNENIALLADLACALIDHPAQEEFSTVESQMDNPVRI